MTQPLHWDVRDAIIGLSLMISGPFSTTLVGDSITEGFWWNMFGACRVVNAGYGGAAVEDLSRLQTVLASPIAPKYAIIMIGINDAIPNITQGQIDSFDHALEWLVVLLHAKGTNVILSTIMPLEAGKALSSSRSQDSINQLNRVIRGKAQSQGLHLIDFDLNLMNHATGMAFTGGTLDGIHPSRATYITMYYAYSGALNAEISRTGVPCGDG